MEQNARRPFLLRALIAVLPVAAAVFSAKADDPEWVCDGSHRPGETVDVATSVSCAIAPGRMPASVATIDSVERRRFVREISSARSIDRRKVGFGFVLR
jgi:hypothetical protein